MNNKTVKFEVVCPVCKGKGFNSIENDGIKEEVSVSPATEENGQGSKVKGKEEAQPVKCTVCDGRGTRTFSAKAILDIVDQVKIDRIVAECYGDETEKLKSETDIERLKQDLQLNVAEITDEDWTKLIMEKLSSPETATAMMAFIKLRKIQELFYHIAELEIALVEMPFGVDIRRGDDKGDAERKAIWEAYKKTVSPFRGENKRTDARPA